MKKNMNQATKPLTLLTTTALFAAMITLMTTYILHIPYGANGGYVHFGDALIYLAAVLLPRPYAIAAAVIGGGLSDLLTAPMWAPATILIKALITLPFTSQNPHLMNHQNIIAPVFAALISITGYYLAEGLIFGSFATAAASAFGNVIQGIGSMVIFFILAGAFSKANIKARLIQ